MHPKKYLRLALWTLVLPIGPVGFSFAQETPSQPSSETKQDNTITLKDVSNENQTASSSQKRNLSRWNEGAVIANPNNPSDFIDPLLEDDPGKGYDLPPGKTSFVIDLGDFSTMEEFFVHSFEAKGTLSFEYSGSIDNDNWKPFKKDIPFSPDEVTDFDLNQIEGRYVRITFNTTTPGKISNLNILGERSIPEGLRSLASKSPELAVEGEKNRAEVSSKNAADSAQNTNLAALGTGSKISHVSSGADGSAPNMIDSDFRTGHTFDPADKNPVFIAKLQDGQNIERVNVLANAGPGTMEFTFLADLPESFQTAPSKTPGQPNVLNVPADYFAKNPSNFSTTVTETGVQQMGVNLAQPRDAGYLLFRWTPSDPNQGGFSVTHLHVAKTPNERALPSFRQQRVQALTSKLNATNSRRGLRPNIQGLFSVPPDINPVSP